jgi:methionine synthase II (cobalamin-independent)
MLLAVVSLVCLLLFNIIHQYAIIGHIQLDDPTFCYFCSENMISGMEEAGVDHQALLDTYIRAINVCVKDRPADLQVSVHLCRGNFKVSLYLSVAVDE